MMTPVQLHPPCGIQTFRRIREDGYYYVDKTPFALQLLEQGDRYYFLSRPRRFGRSLLLDTLCDLFSGHRELFAGLYAEDHWDWSVQYPVVRLSLVMGGEQDVAEIASSLNYQLGCAEEQYGLEPGDPEDLEVRLRDLIRRLHQQTGQPVVVLMDEYEKPLLNVLEKPERAAPVRESLHQLYSALRACDAHLHFVLLTGVTRFPKESLCSGLDGLHDITLDPAYATICGFTEAEIDRVLGLELAGLDRELIRSWYQGYSWGGERVYNPSDLLLLVLKRDFHVYWFEVGTPSFLVEALSRPAFAALELETLLSEEIRLSEPELASDSPEALLFQTGYLSIRGVTEVGGERIYSLGVPNWEVERSLEVLLDYRPGHRDRRRARLRSRAVAAQRDAVTDD